MCLEIWVCLNLFFFCFLSVSSLFLLPSDTERLSLDSSSKATGYTSFGSERISSLQHPMEENPYINYTAPASSYMPGNGSTGGGTVGVAPDLTPTSSQQFFSSATTSVSHVEGSAPSSSSSYPAHSMAKDWPTPITSVSSVSSSLEVLPEPVDLTQQMGRLAIDPDSGSSYQESPAHYTSAGLDSQFSRPPPVSTTAEYQHPMKDQVSKRGSIAKSAYPGDRVEASHMRKSINMEELHARIQVLEKELERSRHGPPPPPSRERFDYQRQHSTSSTLYGTGISPHSTGLVKPPSYSGPIPMPQYSPSNTGTHTILPPATPPGMYYPSGNL